ncbi:MAG TPA: FHA domain-containing protein [Pirellulaceae bacterium]|jgi:DNA-binding CsgD family transcriptional regulator
MPAAYLVMTNVAPSDWLGTLTANRQIIGRGEDADIRIPGDYVHVSRRHAEVWIENDGYWLMELGSTSGTRLNSVPLVPKQRFRLIVGDHLWLGAAELDLVANPNDSNRAMRRPQESTVGYIIGKSGNAEFPGAPADDFATLTPAELEVVLWMSRGLTDPTDVAESLFRSPHTIRTHLASIFSKLNVHSRDQLLACLARRTSPPGAANSARIRGS